MTKWIADYEVESHLSLLKNKSKLKYKDPNDLYEVHIKDLNVKPPIEKPLLSVQVILDSNSIDEVAGKSKDYLKFFLCVLSLITNNKFSIHRLVRVVDWTSGLSMRDCHQYHTSPDINIPFPVLDEKLIDSIHILMKNNISDELRRALKWFSRGVGASYLDEQFQYFWFALETMAENNKETAKVPDQCPKCNSALYCEICKETSTHKPYPKQAIEQLIKKVVKNDPEKICAMLSKVRHALLHGNDTDDVERSFSTDMSQLVDILGQTVWVTLLNSFQAPSEGATLSFLKTNTYSHRRLVTKVVMRVGGGSSKGEPDIEHIPLVQMEMNVTDEQDMKKAEE